MARPPRPQARNYCLMIAIIPEMIRNDEEARDIPEDVFVTNETLSRCWRLSRFCNITPSGPHTASSSPDTIYCQRHSRKICSYDNRILLFPLYHISLIPEDNLLSMFSFYASNNMYVFYSCLFYCPPAPLAVPWHPLPDTENSFIGTSRDRSNICFLKWPVVWPHYLFIWSYHWGSLRKYQQKWENEWNQDGLVKLVFVMQTKFSETPHISQSPVSVSRHTWHCHAVMSRMSRIVSSGANGVFSSATDSRGPGGECNKIVTRLSEDITRDHVWSVMMTKC